MSPDQSQYFTPRQLVVHHYRKKRKLQEQSRFLPCPVCQRSFPCYFIDDHVNTCLDNPSTFCSTSSTSFLSSCDLQKSQIGSKDHDLHSKTLGSFTKARVLYNEVDLQDRCKGPTAEPSCPQSKLIVGSSKPVLPLSIRIKDASRLSVQEDVDECEDAKDGDSAMQVHSGAGSHKLLSHGCQTKWDSSTTQTSPQSLGTVGIAPTELIEEVENESDSSLSGELIKELDTHEQAVATPTKYVSERPGPGFQFVQVQRLSQAKLSMLGNFPMSSTLERKPSVTVLQSGMVLLRSWLSLDIQQKLVKESQTVAHRFRRPTTAGGGQYHLYSTTFGCQWDAKTRRYAAREGDARLPEWMFELSRKLASDAHKHTHVYAPVSVFEPDVALVNFYPVKAEELGVVGLGGHQDLDDFCEMPVVSVSVGDNMTFFYRRLPPLSRRKSGVQIIVDESAAKNCKYGDIAHNREQKIILESGDVLIFGGESRLVYHGTRNVQPGTRPPGLHMIPGRLNFTFRQCNAK